MWRNKEILNHARKMQGVTDWNPITIGLATFHPATRKDVYEIIAANRNLPPQEKALWLWRNHRIGPCPSAQSSWSRWVEDSHLYHYALQWPVRRG